MSVGMAAVMVSTAQVQVPISAAARVASSRIVRRRHVRDRAGHAGRHVKKHAGRVGRCNGNRQGVHRRADGLHAGGRVSGKPRNVRCRHLPSWQTGRRMSCLVNWHEDLQALEAQKARRQKADPLDAVARRERRDHPGIRRRSAAGRSRRTLPPWYTAGAQVRVPRRHAMWKSSSDCLTSFKPGAAVRCVWGESYSDAESEGFLGADCAAAPLRMTEFCGNQEIAHSVLLPSCQTGRGVPPGKGRRRKVEGRLPNLLPSAFCLALRLPLTLPAAALPRFARR